MRNLLAVLVIAALVAPVYAGIEYFPVAGDGSFDTYHNSDMSASEGYSNGGGTGGARLGYAKQGIGWVAWDAKTSNGTETVSVGDVTGQTLATYLAANPGVHGNLWLNLGTASLVGTYAVETLRCGNTGVIQEDDGGVGPSWSAPAAGITGSTEPFAWAAAAPAYLTNGLINNPTTPTGVAYIAAGTTSSHYAGGGFTVGQPIQWGTNSKLGFDGTMAANGGDAWALACLIGSDWSQGGTSVARANTAGQVVNLDGNGAPVFLGVDKYVGSVAPRAGAASGNWYKVPISDALLASLVNADGKTKALLFNNWFAGTSSSSGNPYFVTKEQSGGSGRAFLEITPEPATMILLAMGGLALLRRRS
jgi:hypothetical protein